MKYFKDNFFLHIVFLIFTVIIIFILAEFCIRIVPISKYWEGDITDFWDMEQYTNILGNYNNKKIINIKHTGIRENIAKKVPVERLQNTVRIICLGTSSTEGAFIDNVKDIYPEVLERLLNGGLGSRSYEVINAAVGGYTSFQLLIYFEQVLLKLNPDVVILYLTYNDMQYNGPGSDKEYYRWIREEVEDLPCDMKKNFIKYHSVNPFAIKLSNLLNKSKFYIFYKSLILNIKQKLNKIHYIDRVSPGDFKEVLEQFVKLAKENDFYLIFIPEAITENSYGVNVFDIKKYHRIMEDIAGENRDVILVKVHRLLNQNSKELFFDKVHPTKKGHFIIAEKIYETFKKEDIIK